MICPHEIPKGACKTGQAIQCALVNARLRWGHGFSVKEHCAICPNQDGKAPVVEATVEGARRARVLTAAPRYAATWKDKPTAQITVRALRNEHGYTPSSLRLLLREAVSRGLDPREAADIADAEGFGDV